MIMLNNTFWNYVNEIQSICMGSDPTNHNFSRKYGSITRDRLLLDVANKYGSITRDRIIVDVTNKYGSITRDRLLLDVANKSSLDLYQYFYIKQGKQVYLDNQNDFKASRLNLLARTKNIPLQRYLCRVNLSREMTCPLCKTDTDEDLEHFLLHCPNFSSIRIVFFKVFDSFVENQKYDLKSMELPSSAKLQFLIGDIGYAFSNEFGIFYDVHGKNVSE